MVLNFVFYYCDVERLCYTVHRNGKESERRACEIDSWFCHLQWDRQCSLSTLYLETSRCYDSTTKGRFKNKKISLIINKYSLYHVEQRKFSAEICHAFSSS